MARAPRHAVVAAVLCLVALVAGCTVGPSQRPPVAVRGENMPMIQTPEQSLPELPPELPEPQEQRATIPFFECTQDTLLSLAEPFPADRQVQVQCGELTVPADPDQTGTGAVTLSVIRVSGAGASPDRPPLLVLGDTTRDPAARHAAVMAGQVSPALLERFTLIGLDRRGSGTDILDCAPDAARAALVDADPAAAGETGLSALLERAREVVQECNLDLDGGLGSYRTSATAADVDLLREALGVDRLSAIGTGDGAAALATWARTTPQSVGRLVLDGPPNPTLDEPDLSDTRAAAAEAAFGAFAVACAGRQGGCPLGTNPRATVTGLVAQLRDRPLLAADGRRLTAGGVLTTLLNGLGEPRSWPALTAAIAAAGAGDAVPMLTLLEPVVGPRGRYDGMLATNCNDTRRRLSPGEVGDIAQRWHTSYPLFGGTFATGLLACAPWSTGSAAPLTGQADGAPPILVIGTAADPRAPLEGSRRAAESLATARFVSWQGSGTGAYPRTACVSSVVDAMLIDGTAPTSDTLCPP